MKECVAGSDPLGWVVKPTAGDQTPDTGASGMGTLRTEASQYPEWVYQPFPRRNGYRAASDRDFPFWMSVCQLRLARISLPFGSGTNARRWTSCRPEWLNAERGRENVSQRSQVPLHTKSPPPVLDGPGQAKSAAA